jgi:4-methyl-5(b-hydroxyethyl)-thiazole monophosphate biosynthesis
MQFQLMTHTALVALANGFEEIEAACIVDVLRRADVAVTIASVGSIDVTGAHGMVWRSDGLIGDCIETIYDLVVLPGGMPGATNLQHSTDLTTILKEQASSGRLYAAICASPSVVLAHHGAPHVTPDLRTSCLTKPKSKTVWSWTGIASRAKARERQWNSL